MKEITIESFDGHAISVLHSDPVPGKPYLTIVLPFGLRAKAAGELCARLSPHFNVLTWQSRSIIDCPEGAAGEIVLTPHMHANDMVQVLRHFRVGTGNVVGFCSGAGIALLAASEWRRMIDRLVLVCGEYMLPPEICPQTNFQREVDSLLPLAAIDRRSAASLCEKLKISRSKAESEFDEEVVLPFSNPEYLYRHGINYLTYRQVDFRDVAKSVPHRTLLISTENDKQVTVQSSRHIADLLPNRKEHIVLPGDHYEILRGRAEMVDALTAFLNEDALIR
jgi:pimeloyl-ACP methyl ester carboxylesterase